MPLDWRTVTPAEGTNAVRRSRTGLQGSSLDFLVAPVEAALPRASAAASLGPLGALVAAPPLSKATPHSLPPNPRHVQREAAYGATAQQRSLSAFMAVSSPPLPCFGSSLTERPQTAVPAGQTANSASAGHDGLPLLHVCLDIGEQDQVPQLGPSPAESFVVPSEHRSTTPVASALKRFVWPGAPCSSPGSFRCERTGAA